MHNVLNQWIADHRMYTIISDHALTAGERRDVERDALALETRLRLGVAPLVTTPSPDDAAIPAGILFDRTVRRMRGEGAVSMNPELKRRRTEVEFPASYE